MTKFEYLRAVFRTDTNGVERLEYISETAQYGKIEEDSTDQVLNTLGEQGWELVSSNFHPLASLTTHIFKRAKSEVQPAGDLPPVGYSQRIY
jgi:hypothetical protein